MLIPLAITPRRAEQAIRSATAWRHRCSHRGCLQPFSLDRLAARGKGRGGEHRVISMAPTLLLLIPAAGRIDSRKVSAAPTNVYNTQNIVVTHNNNVHMAYLHSKNVYVAHEAYKHQHNFWRKRYEHAVHSLLEYNGSTGL